MEKNPFQHKPHPYEQSGSGELSYELFYSEMQKLKDSGNPYLKDVDLQQLTPYDVRTWMWFVAGSLGERVFAERKRSAEREITSQGAQVSGHARERFYAYLGDQMTNRIAAEQLSEMQKARK
jgi:hypothetical protein